MADLVLTGSIALNKNSLTKTMRFTSGITILFVPVASGPQGISTNWTQLNFGNVTAAGYLSYLNLDGSNYIELSADSAGANKFAKVSPAMGGAFELATGVTIYGRANTTTVNLDYTLFSR